jgi:hypothetical protein
MNEVSKNRGRTVLFVSHNIEAVIKLCPRVVFLDSGHVRAIGDAKIVVPDYLHSQSSSPRVVDLLSKARAFEFAGTLRLAKASPSDAASNWLIPFGRKLSLDLSIQAQSSATEANVFIDIYSAGGFELASWSNRCSNYQLSVQPGLNIFRIEFQHLRLLPGRYSIGITLGGDRDYEDAIPEAIRFEIIPSFEAAEINADIFGGAFVPSATVTALNQASRN